jgi:SAM-dependent methyltransferase
VFAPELSGSAERLQRVLAAYATSSWAELLPALHPKGLVPEGAAAAAWAEARIQRHERFYMMFRARARQIWPEQRQRVACEIGCGRGDGLLALARDFEHVVGIDVNLAALLGAKKLLAERGVQNVTLLQASAHALPFPAASFDYVQAINVIEHVFRPEHFFSEVKRVLAAEGTFCGDSRNRFDAFFPEPHVKLMWVGFLPRRFADPYVRWRKQGRRGYSSAQLLSYFELRRALTRNFGQHCRIVLPDIEAYAPRAPGVIKRVVEDLHEARRLEQAALPLFPTHLALARG